MSPRQRPLFIALGVLGLVWILALGGFAISRSRKVTPEKIIAFLNRTQFQTLTIKVRKDALRHLAEMLNLLSSEDRRSVRLTGAWRTWFSSMDANEKGEFMELTLPVGFNQMLTAFEQMPPEKRRDTIDGTLRRLREAESRMASDSPENRGVGGDPIEQLSPELRNKMISTGLKAFMDQGSSETKAELQPVLEEMQRSMESGRMLRPRRRP
ncbi:MAG: hypothetical protein EXS25_10940 [Pedosphaera sp.]|nr:hypothetical protein [Pedosphaera sp.]